MCLYSSDPIYHHFFCLFLFLCNDVVGEEIIIMTSIFQCDWIIRFYFVKLSPPAVAGYRAWGAQPVVRGPRIPIFDSTYGIFYRYQLLISYIATRFGRTLFSFLPVSSCFPFNISIKLPPPPFLVTCVMSFFNFIIEF